MSTRFQKNKQVPAECFVKTIRQRPRPIQSHPTPIEQPSTPASDPSLSDLTDLPEPRGRKRRRAFEQIPAPDPSPDPSPDPAPAVESVLSPSCTHLTKKNLDELERLSGISASHGIGHAPTPSGRGGKKRSSSRHSSTAEMEETISDSSQRTTTQANYRYRNLDDARIVVEATDIPTNIESMVNAIIQPNLSVSRRSELASIAETFCNNFSRVVKGAGRKDDSLELIHTALTAMDKGQKFLFPRKAGIPSPWPTPLHHPAPLWFCCLGAKLKAFQTKNLAIQDSCQQPRRFNQSEYGRSAERGGS